MAAAVEQRAFPLLRYDPSLPGAFGERHEQCEGTRAEGGRRAVDEQPLRIGLQVEAAEAVAGGGCCDGHSLDRA